MVLESYITRLKLSLGFIPRTGLDSEWVARVDECLEKVVDWTTQNIDSNYFVKPKEEFFNSFGRVLPEDEFYQMRMNYFLEWCVLERPVSGRTDGQTPSSLFLQDTSNESQKESREFWASVVGAHRHSVFEVIASSDTVIIVRDLLARHIYRIMSQPGVTLKFFVRKMIFQGFIYGFGGLYRLGSGYIIHPDGARYTITRQIKSRDCPESDVLKKLALVNMRFRRMQHVESKQIYTQYLRLIQS
jgi:hypothetical protein